MKQIRKRKEKYRTKTKKKAILFLNKEKDKKLLKEHKARHLEMAKKHLELVKEKVLDGFESDETVTYEAPKQKKYETVKLKTLHRLKGKKRLSRQNNRSY